MAQQGIDAKVADSSVRRQTAGIWRRSLRLSTAAQAMPHDRPVHSGHPGQKAQRDHWKSNDVEHVNGRVVSLELLGGVAGFSASSDAFGHLFAAGPPIRQMIGTYFEVSSRSGAARRRSLQAFMEKTPQTPAASENLACLND